MLLNLWFCGEYCYDKPNEIKFSGPQKWRIFVGKGVRLYGVVMLKLVLSGVVGVAHFITGHEQS